MKHRTISTYQQNGTWFETVESLNKKDERVYVKQNPLDKYVPSDVPHILDRPKDVNWTIKNSHIDHTDIINGNDKITAISAGSVAVDSSAIFSKENDDFVYFFPLEPIGNRPVNKFDTVGNMETGTFCSIHTDSPTWVGYITISGTITRIR